MNVLKWITDNQLIVGGGIGFALLIAGMWLTKDNLKKWGIAFALVLIRSLGKKNAQVIIDDLNAFIDAADAEVDRP